MLSFWGTMPRAFKSLSFISWQDGARSPLESGIQMARENDIIMDLHQFLAESHLHYR